jgi:hypothetical protein
MLAFLSAHGPSPRKAALDPASAYWGAAGIVEGRCSIISRLCERRHSPSRLGWIIYVLRRALYSIFKLWSPSSNGFLVRQGVMAERTVVSRPDLPLFPL